MRRRLRCEWGDFLGTVKINMGNVNSSEERKGIEMVKKLGL